MRGWARLHPVLLLTGSATLLEASWQRHGWFDLNELPPDEPPSQAWNSITPSPITESTASGWWEQGSGSTNTPIATGDWPAGYRVHQLAQPAASSFFGAPGWSSAAGRQQGGPHESGESSANRWPIANANNWEHHGAGAGDNSIVLADVYNWNILKKEMSENDISRNHPDQEVERDSKIPKFLAYLNKKLQRDREDFFWICRVDAGQTIYKLNASIEKFRYPKKIQAENRYSHIFNILLDLSNEKIKLDDHKFFSIPIQQFTDRLEERHINDPDLPNKFRTFREDVTKVAQFLIVIDLSIFKEHTEAQLKLAEVEKHVNFINGLWTDIENGKTIEEYDWSKRIHDLIHSQVPAGETPLEVTFTAKKRLAAGHFVDYWREKNGKRLLDEHGLDCNIRLLTKLINRMIFFTNEKNIPKRARPRPRVRTQH